MKKILQHLREDYILPVRDPLWKHIYLSRGLKSIMSTPDFLRLGRIKQLGPASLIYPGATHSRLNHSLGVFYLSYNIIITLVQKPHCPKLSLPGVKAFLAAAFLHDLGHFPHAHAFKELPLKDHEQLSAETILNGPINEIITHEIGTDPEFCAAIIDKSRCYPEKRELIFYRNLLSGVLDPDKLDYLTRDAYFCGVPYGIQDTDYVLSQIEPIESGLAIPYRGITAIENVLFSKYLMYKTVYWHRGVRISTALVKKAVYMALKENQLTSEELYGMDDDSFLKKMLSLRPGLFTMMEDSETPNKHKILHSWDYEKNNSEHSKYKDMEYRLQREIEISQRLKDFGYSLEPHQVIIDMTGAISFEVDLPVLIHGKLIPFPETDTVFTREVVHDFTEGLQKIQLILPAEICREITASSNFKEILEVIHI